MPDVQPPDWETWYTPEETMRRLGITPKQLDRLTDEGILNDYREGGSRWILQYDVDTYSPNGAPNPDHESDDPPPVDPNSWIPTIAASEILNISCAAVNSLARRGKLSRKVEAHRALFQECEVVLLARAREKRREERFDPRQSIHWWGNRSGRRRFVEGDQLITTREAAGILGVHYQTVTHLVRRGLLPASQKRPGKQGSPLLVSAFTVRRLADRPTNQKRRLNTQPSTLDSYTKGWEEHELEEVPRRGHTLHSTRDRGEFYSTRQVAALLGVHPSRVRAMARTGRLTPIRHKARMKGPYERREPCTGNRWLFFRKEEVHALQADHDYCDRHRRYVTGCKRKADGPKPVDLARLDRELDSCLRANRQNPGTRLEHLDPADPPTYLFDPDDWRIALE